MRVKDAAKIWPPINPTGSYRGSDHLDVDPNTAKIQEAIVYESEEAVRITVKDKHLLLRSAGESGKIRW